MFTGIIEVVGRVVDVRRGGSGAALTIATPRRLPRLALGESIAVNGACLTVTRRAGTGFTVDVSPETLRRTTLGGFRAGTRVNLERALRFGDRLGGHVVQGHVDGTGRLERIAPDGAWVAYRFSAPAHLAPYLVEKGSIAVDGVSLTVFDCRGGRFTVALIPHTLAKTTLGKLRPGDAVNLEADVLLKHVAAMLRRNVRAPTRPSRRA
ncbi:MAG TPA: riboflavin synthase [Candidatus Binatia bacterium]|nr:riboflavin synthase [Candidatus Binatia bacterium]